MKVYVVHGYESPDYTTDWSVFGVYAKRIDAENKIISLAHKIVAELNSCSWFDPSTINCWYRKEDNKLSSIYCDNCEFEFAIAETELKGE